MGGRFHVTRYNPDGTLDSSFGGDGDVKVWFGRSNRARIAEAVDLEPNGNIIVAGSAGHHAGRRSSVAFAVARLNPFGSLDPTFAGDGRALTWRSGINLAHALVIQPDGKIIVAGPKGRKWFGLVRYDGDGTRDAIFGDEGKVITDLTRIYRDYVSGVALQPDGKILAAGHAGRRFGVVRYNVDGGLDSSFSSDGKVLTKFSGGIASAHGMAIQADGRFVVVGVRNPLDRDGARSKFALARYLAQ